jgi:6-phosphogluconolactonase/glucosamine-6-phosphate isomerase/deaminase
MDWTQFSTADLDSAVWKEKMMQAYRFRARIVKDKEEMDRTVVEDYIMPRFLFDLSRDRDFIMMAATGNTPKGIWDLLVKVLHSNPALLEGFRRIAYISQLDERLNIPKNSVHSFSNYILTRIINPIGLDESHMHLLDGCAQDPFKEIKSLANWIMGMSKIGPDLAVVPFGPDHIAYILKGVSRLDTCKIVRFTDITLAAMAVEFVDSEFAVPSHGMTLVGELLDSQAFVRPCSNVNYADMIRRSLEDDMTPECTGTYLQCYRCCTAVITLDVAIAAGLSRENKDYDWSLVPE